MGVSGWLLAHAVTFWLSVRSLAGIPQSDQHVHAPAASATVIGALVATSILALGLTAKRRGGKPSSTLSLAGVAGSVGLSTLVFLAADAAEHSALGLAPTPPVLLMLGALLHLLLSVGSSLVWLRFSGAVLVLLAWLHASAEPSAARRIRAPQRAQGPRRLLWAAAVAGRAPPMS